MKPTLINNVETYANITKIILNGSKWYSSIGTEKSKGTKVFALGGNVVNVGLVEVPMGTTLREIVFDIGGGIPNGKKFKAAQTGDFLVYEEVDGEGVWVNKKAADVSKLILGQLTGATETTDGTSGVVPAPKAGDQGKFLRGDGTWAAIPGIEDIATLKTTVSTLIGDDFGQSVRAIALDTLTKALIPEDAKESLDTLQEIADWIQNHPSSPAEFNSEIKRLQEAVFDTTNAETGEVIPGLQTKVANFSTILSTLQVSVGDHETRIESIEETIKWHDMNETDGSEIN